MSKLEPYLTDGEVARVQEKMYDEFPVLSDYHTDLVTARIEPPWYGQLPDGTTGHTNHAVVQFVAVSDNPRPIQRKMGVRHATVAAVWPQAFEDARSEQKHFVVGEQTIDPLERIFRMVIAKHLDEMDSLKSIMN
jgi:hypothetical protein